jgi:hypothetical protein
MVARGTLVNDLGDLAFQALSGGFVLGFLFVFFGGVLFGAVAFVKRMLG